MAALSELPPGTLLSVARASRRRADCVLQRRIEAALRLPTGRGDALLLRGSDAAARAAHTLSLEGAEGLWTAILGARSGLDH